MSEYKRKTLRSFYCEEALWKSYEKLAKERDATIDQLLSEALQSFLDVGSSAPAPAAPASAPAPAPAPAAPPAPAAEPPRPAAPALSGGQASITERPTMERMAPVRSPKPAPPPPPARPPAPPRAPAAPAAGTGMPKLFLHYGGRVHPVATERFVIGRGSKGTDLTIRDGNISRKHAVVLFHEGSFYIQDLGSTNGVEYNGQRVDSKNIEEGDVFSICDHEITFSYRG